MTRVNETYADHFHGEHRQDAVRSGFDGWLTAVRAFFFLIAGMLLISFFTTI